MQGDPINPLDPLDQPDPAADDGANLPAPEPLEDPVPEFELADQAPEPAPAAERNGSSPTRAEIETAVLAAQGAARRAAGRTSGQGPVIGDVVQLGAIQSDAEQALAEIRATRRALQMLLLAVAGAAALVALYFVRAARTPAPATTIAKGV